MLAYNQLFPSCSFPSISPTHIPMSTWSSLAIPPTLWLPSLLLCSVEPPFLIPRLCQVFVDLHATGVPCNLHRSSRATRAWGSLPFCPRWWLRLHHPCINATLSRGVVCIPSMTSESRCDFLTPGDGDASCLTENWAASAFQSPRLLCLCGCFAFVLLSLLPCLLLQ